MGINSSPLMRKYYRQIAMLHASLETRLDDPNIRQFMKSVDVRKVLKLRTVSLFLQRDLTLDDNINQAWFHPRHLQGIDKKAWVESEPLEA